MEVIELFAICLGVVAVGGFITIAVTALTVWLNEFKD